MNEFHDYQPGDGFRYRIGIFELNDNAGYLVTWLATRVTGISFYFRAGNNFNLDYVADKMNISIADAFAIMTFTQQRAPIVIDDLAQWKSILEAERPGPRAKA